ncbi:aminoglycoside phosphotransferase family protein [Ruminococcaceae bacterium OttesenSCG-928-L11]|nr:aminoglycoside phosphotransferase family protein [Ruminococcaceae bacterium OttesenSCG-928-L11]
MDLFRGTIQDWETWSQVYCSMELFEPLAREIYRRHAIPFSGLSALTPGTNAVFRAGDTVVKIYAPAETTIEPDWAELGGLQHARAAGVQVPALLTWGELHDRYAFRYLIMEHISGREAGDCIASLSQGDKAALATELKAVTERWGIPCTSRDVPDNVAANVYINTRWHPFPTQLQRDALDAAKALEQAGSADFVYVHGDLTGENVLLTDRGLRVIDFGDSHVAPPWYEWPPVIFELFRCDAAMMTAYFGDYQTPAFYRTLTDAILLHDFGGDIVMTHCRRIGMDIQAVTDRDALQALLEQSV